MDEGRISQVGGDNHGSPDAVEIDVTGRSIIPGMIDAHCHIGIMAEGVGEAEYDVNELTDPITPQMRAIDAIHPHDIAFADARCAGVTAVNVGPGSGNLIGGQCALIRTVGRTVEEMSVLAPSAMKMALGENPKRVYGRKQNKAPATRMANAAILREWLMKAQDYLDCADIQGSSRTSSAGKRDLRLMELARVLKGEIPVHMHCHRADDIITAIRISEEFGFRLVLIHATEGYLVADIIAEKRIPCVVGSLIRSRRKYELRGKRWDNLARLVDAGVKVAIQTDELSATSLLRFSAVLAVQYGVPEAVALRAITLTPAEILGVEDRLGSLKPGKEADVVVLSGDPLDMAHSVPERVFVKGAAVTSTSRTSQRGSCADLAREEWT
jgi:imidazolonepropionase-like amidohydrolase